MKPGEPSGPIQLIPPGLLGLLQIKSPAGQNPNVLNADVQPTIDLLPFWLRANRQVWNLNSGITVGPGASGLFTQFSPHSIIVPQNEWWYVHSYTVAFLAQATTLFDGARLAMSWNQTGTQRFQMIGNERSVDYVDSSWGSVALSAFEFWVPPGAELGCYFAEITVADVQVDVRGLDYTVCPI